jgi:hypothetical protein
LRIVGDPTPPWMPPVPPRSSLSGVALSFVVSLLVYLAVCALALWICGRVRSLGRNDNRRGRNWRHTIHQHSCPGSMVGLPVTLCSPLCWGWAIHNVGEPTMWSFGLWHSCFAHRTVVRPVMSSCLRLGSPVVIGPIATVLSCALGLELFRGWPGF